DVIPGRQEVVAHAELESKIAPHLPVVLHIELKLVEAAEVECVIRALGVILEIPEQYVGDDVACRVTGRRVESNITLIAQPDVFVGTAARDLGPDLQCVRADYFAEIVAPLERGRIFLDAVAAVISAKPRNVQIRADTETIGRINLWEGNAQRTAPQDCV